MAGNTETEKHLKTVTKWAGLFFIGMIISKILSYLFRLVIAKYYGPDFYGIFSVGISVMILLTAIIVLGLDSGIIRFVAFYSAKNDKGRVKGALITPFRICIPIALTASLAMWIFAPYIAGCFSVNPNQAIYLASIFRIFSFSIPFSMAYSLIISMNKGLQSVKFNIYADYIFSSSLQIVLALLFYSMGFDITGVALAYLLSIMLTFLFILYFSRGNFLSIMRSKTVLYAREMLSYSLPLAASNFASIAITTIDTIFLGVFRTPTETGVYNAAMPTAGIIYLFASAFSMLFFPILTELYSKKLVPEMKAFYRTVTNWIFIVTFPFFLVFFIFSANILTILFGPEYAAGAGAMSILSVTYLINSMFATSAFVLLVLEKTKYTLINVILTATLICSLNITLTPVFGIYGAAVSSVVSSAFFGVLLCIETMYFARLNPFSLKIMAKSVFVGVVSAGFVYYLYKNLLLQGSLPLFILLLMLFLVLYSLIMLVIGSFGREDLVILSSIEKKLGIRSNLLRKIIKRFIHD